MAYARTWVVEMAAEKKVGSPPCRGCAERVVGCAGKCEKYKDWKQRVIETRRELIAQDSAERAGVAYRKESYERAVKDGLVRERKRGYRKKHDPHKL